VRPSNRRILYIQFADPGGYPPLEHSSHILAERGWSVTLLGTHVFGSNRNLAVSLHPRIRAKNLSVAKFGGKLHLQYACFFLWCLYWVCAWRPAWVYASDPLAVPAVWFIRKLTKVRVVYHEHDSPPSDYGRSWFTRIVLPYRTALSKQAELCIIPQHERLAAFLVATGRQGRTMCVWNCPRLHEVRVGCPEDRSEQVDDLVLYYHGSINNHRLPPELVAAASRFGGKVRLRVVGYEAPGSIGYVKDLKKLAAELGTPEIVEYLGIISREEMLQIAAHSHVGVSLMPKKSTDINLQHMLGASNKSFEFMASGLPLLVTALPAWNSTFVGPGYGRACDPESVASIAAQLAWYVDNPDKRLEMGRRCIDKILSDWNYEAMFASVVVTLETT